MILEDTISKKVAQSDGRAPTAENNLKEIKNLFEEAKLSSETKEIEKLLNELSSFLQLNYDSRIYFDRPFLSGSVLHQLDQKIIYPHYDFKHLTEKYFEIGMKLNDFSIQLVKY